jgi:hypothetical protein
MSETPPTRPPGGRPQIPEVVRAAIESLKTSPFGRIMEELDAVKNDPRSQIILAHGMVELMVNLLVEKLCKNGKKINNDRRGYSHSTKLVILHEKNVLTDHHFRLLNWFRARRNDVAHQPFFKLDTSMLSDFELERHRDLTKFGDLCNAILMDLWDQHSGVISPYFMPGVQHAKVTFLPAGSQQPKYLIPLKSDKTGKAAGDEPD